MVTPLGSIYYIHQRERTQSTYNRGINTCAAAFGAVPSKPVLVLLSCASTVASCREASAACVCAAASASSAAVADSTASAFCLERVWAVSESVANRSVAARNADS